MLELCIKLYKDKGFGFYSERREKMKTLAYHYRRKLKTPQVLSLWLERTDEGLQAIFLELLARQVSNRLSKTLRKYRDIKFEDEVHLLHPAYMRV
jgi:hypothetical protein